MRYERRVEIFGSHLPEQLGDAKLPKMPPDEGKCGEARCALKGVEPVARVRVLADVGPALQGELDAVAGVEREGQEDSEDLDEGEQGQVVDVVHCPIEGRLPGHPLGVR